MSVFPSSGYCSYCKCGTWLHAWRRNIKESLIWAQERRQSCGFAPAWLAAPVSWMTQSSPLTGNSSPGSFLLIKAHRRDARRLTCKWLLSPEPSAASAKWRNNTRQQCGSVLLAALRCVWTSRYILPTVHEKPEKGSVSDSPLYRRSTPPTPPPPLPMHSLQCKSKWSTCACECANTEHSRIIHHHPLCDLHSGLGFSF